MNPLPRIQQLCLVDLPTELLDAIYLRASLANGRILSSTCRRLNEVGRRHVFGVGSLLARFSFNWIVFRAGISYLNSRLTVLCTRG